MIYADVVKLPDGSYALIQPKIEFEEFYKLIYEGTSRAQAKDRDAAFDIWKGSTLYAGALNKVRHCNLALVLVLSIILGDYSVHSGNMVFLNEKNQEEQGAGASPLPSGPDEDEPEKLEAPERLVARIDWGAAFRLYGENDNENIFSCAEYTGVLGWLKTFTKNYLRFYREVPDLFDKQMPNQSIKLRNKLGDNEAQQKEKLKNILLAAINKIPIDLIDEATRDQLTDYLCMQTVAAACKSDSNNISMASSKSPNEEFAAALVKIMYPRIVAVAKLSKEKRLELELAILSEEFRQREAEFKQQTAAQQAQVAAQHLAAIAEKASEIERIQAELATERQAKQAAEQQTRALEAEKKASEQKSLSEAQALQIQIAQLKGQIEEKARGYAADFKQRDGEIATLGSQIASLQAEQKATQDAAYKACISTFFFAGSAGIAIAIISLKGLAILFTYSAILLITPAVIGAIALPFSVYYSGKAMGFFKPHEERPVVPVEGCSRAHAAV